MKQLYPEQHDQAKRPHDFYNIILHPLQIVIIVSCCSPHLRRHTHTLTLLPERGSQSFGGKSKKGEGVKKRGCCLSSPILLLNCQNQPTSRALNTDTSRCPNHLRVWSVPIKVSMHCLCSTYYIPSERH